MSTTPALAAPVLDSRWKLAVGAGDAVPTEEMLLFTPSFVANWKESEDWVVANPTPANGLRQVPLGIVFSSTSTNGTTVGETLCERLQIAFVGSTIPRTGGEVDRA